MSSDKDFIQKCNLHFGKSPEHINYILEDHEDRITQLEQQRESIGPVIAGLIAKLESIGECLIADDIISRHQIDLEVRRLVEKKK